MGRIPPVKIDWGLGFNEELCKVLEECKKDVPEYERDFDIIIGHIKAYGRVKEDANGEYDSLYLFEREAADIIYGLIHHDVARELHVDDIEDENEFLWQVCHELGRYNIDTNEMLLDYVKQRKILLDEKLAQLCEEKKLMNSDYIND